MKSTLTRFDRLMMAVTFAEANMDVEVGEIANQKKHFNDKTCRAQKQQAKRLYNSKAVKACS